MIFRRAQSVALLAALAVVCAWAQNTANLPWWTSGVVQDIGLSPDQMHRIHQITRSYRNRLFDARNNVTKDEADLEDLLNDPKVNLEAAKPVIDRLANDRASVTRVFTSMSVELREVLTAEQWSQLVRRWSEVQKTRKGRDTLVSPPAK